MVKQESLPSEEPARLGQGDLRKYLWGAATLLRGLIDSGDYKQYIFPLLFFKRLSDVYDEERAKALADYGHDEIVNAPENHRFQIPDEAHWEDVRRKPQEVGKAISEAMHAIENANPQHLGGIFGDADWTNAERLPDATLSSLLEHFSTQTLNLARVPEDELGNAYEYLIGKFADDSGHTAQEFYTNRTLVDLMARMLKPLPGESVYDPTCGTGGMLITTVGVVRSRGLEHRALRLYGQERNVMTSSIARMNLFLHGIEEFEIARGDTLDAPAFVADDGLRTFDVVLANPPYSIKQWNRAKFVNDPWGRNVWGTPPQGRADYAFFQHIAASLKPGSGRCAILFPHGVLFRKEERDMREALIRSGLLECVLGLGPGLFYNSPMEACVVVCRTGRPPGERDRVLFINAVNEVTRPRNGQTRLDEEHISRILGVYEAFADEPGFAKVVSTDEVLSRDASLAIPLYVAADYAADRPQLELVRGLWEDSSKATAAAVKALLRIEDSE
ncbi:SAM-dependent DNA methyltransferase [Nonomuraea sp. KC401]|uniref:type I restriction-modification system subunit M n=1 Tax=unclassified Nonomuraea TaxID=2593643 RepID=UPI0010FECF16|nr:MULTISPECIES: class I SAM-dependent DNA methyltransferase [unclassified Nonomuraea]NBE95203.1 N-6 DNA methylase [Nonomuraea sp. K271]TLF71166.1 SAM-dependent DNA methyltransferase [Nonomuraea sp. KC401]